MTPSAVTTLYSHTSPLKHQSNIDYQCELRDGGSTDGFLLTDVLGLESRSFVRSFSMIRFHPLLFPV